MKLEIRKQSRKEHPVVAWLVFLCGVVITLMDFTLIKFDLVILIFSSIFIIFGVIGTIIWYTKGLDKPQIINEEIEVLDYKEKG